MAFELSFRVIGAVRCPWYALVAAAFKGRSSISKRGMGLVSVVARVPHLMSVQCPGQTLDRKCRVDLRTDMAEELGEYRETADDDSNGYFSIGPDAHTKQIVAIIRRFDSLPDVVCTQNRCHTGPEFGTVSRFLSWKMAC